MHFNVKINDSCTCFSMITNCMSLSLTFLAFICHFRFNFIIKKNSSSSKGIAGNIQSRDQPNSLDLQSLTGDSTGLSANSYVNERHRDLAISAVLMDEWLKEMSAISQEMSIVLLNENLKR